MVSCAYRVLSPCVSPRRRTLPLHPSTSLQKSKSAISDWTISSMSVWSSTVGLMLAVKCQPRCAKMRCVVGKTAQPNVFQLIPLLAVASHLLGGRFTSKHSLGRRAAAGNPLL